jgi:hypothetical protein
MKTWLSGYFLEANGWKKNKFEWTKGTTKITYDGTDWLLYSLKLMTYDSKNGVKANPRKIHFIEDLTD